MKIVPVKGGLEKLKSGMISGGWMRRMILALKLEAFGLRTLSKAN
jgi:hypothetical protein